MLKLTYCDALYTSGNENSYYFSSFLRISIYGRVLLARELLITFG